MSDINWSDLRQVADDATKPVPAGRYDVGIVKTEYRTATTGAPMIVANMVVVGGPSDGKTLFHNFVLSVDNGFALKMFFNALDAFGVTADMLATLSGNPARDMPTIAEWLKGRTASAEVKIRQWQGQDRNDLGAFQPAQTTVYGRTIGSLSTGTPGVPSTPSTAPATAPTPSSVPTPTAVPNIPTPTMPATPPPGLPI